MAEDRHGPGRGAWLCRDSPACLEAAVRRHGFDRAFGAAIDAAALAELHAHLGEGWGDATPDVRG